MATSTGGRGRLAMALTQAGLKRGDRVATLMWNHYAHLEAYFGVPVAGGVVHTLNLRLHPDEIAYIVNDAQDRFLIVDDVLLPLFEQFKDRVNLERVFVVPLTGKPIPPGYESYEELLKTGAWRTKFKAETGGHGEGERRGVPLSRTR